jgi:hypothetical protein
MFDQLSAEILASLINKYIGSGVPQGLLDVKSCSRVDVNYNHNLKSKISENKFDFFF